MSAFVPGYEFDIFISYAHVDNLTVVTSEAGWVEQFHKHLEVQLTKRFGRANMVKIWRDQRLDGGQFFDDVIFDRIDRAAVFILLLSPGYMASDYCQGEIRRFYQKAQAEESGLRVGERHRILNVLLDNIPHDRWPEEVGRISGFPFYDASDDDFPEPLDPQDKLFQGPLRDLIRSLYPMLNEFATLRQDVAPFSSPSLPPAAATQAEVPAVPSASSFPSRAVLRQAEPEASAPAPCEDGGGAIYLAEVADSLRSTLKRVTSELRQQGINVYKTIPPPYDLADHDAAVQDVMEKAKLSVHLLDGWEGREIDDEGMTFPQKQAQLGLQHASNQLIWVPRQLDLNEVEDPAHRAFLAHLEDGAGEGASYEFIRGMQSAPEIVREIMSKFEPLNQPAQPAAMQSVLLDTHVKDQLFALETSRVLLENNIQPYINPEEDDPKRNIQILQERLRQVNAMVIFFGQVSLEWVRARLAEAVKIVICENYPVQSFHIVLAPSSQNQEGVVFELPLQNLHIIDNRKGLDADMFHPLLNTLGVAMPV